MAKPSKTSRRATEQVRKQRNKMRLLSRLPFSQLFPYPPLLIIHNRERPFDIATIPPEFQDQLRPANSTEPRADIEILESLTHYIPVMSGKNIWAFWHSGVESMPAWCKHNVINWVRICDGRTVRVLDSVTHSPHNALQSIAPELLPAAFTKGLMDGDYAGPHSADLVQGPLLYHHGGVNIDVEGILVRQGDSNILGRTR